MASNMILWDRVEGWVRKSMADGSMKREEAQRWVNIYNDLSPTKAVFLRTWINNHDSSK